LVRKSPFRLGAIAAPLVASASSRREVEDDIGYEINSGDLRTDLLPAPEGRTRQHVEQDRIAVLYHTHIPRGQIVVAAKASAASTKNRSTAMKNAEGQSLRTLEFQQSATCGGRKVLGGFEIPKGSWGQSDPQVVLDPFEHSRIAHGGVEIRNTTAVPRRRHSTEFMSRPGLKTRS